MTDVDELTRLIISAAIAVHMEMGPGLLESIYELCLVRELKLRGFTVERQVRIALKYKGQALEKNLVLDLVVNGRIVIEVKAVEENHPLHKAQLITYLRLTGLTHGLVLNFGMQTLKEGIQRAVNTLVKPA